MDKMTYRAGTREVNLTRLDSIRDLHSLEMGRAFSAYMM